MQIAPIARENTATDGHGLTQIYFTAENAEGAEIFSSL